MISFDGVKVGDRVRLTRIVQDGSEDKNTETAEFTVVRKTSNRWISSRSRQHHVSAWDEIEPLSPPKPPLPTVPGLYVSREADVGDVDAPLYQFVARDWYSNEHGAWEAFDPADLPVDLVRLVPEGEPSGLLEAAREALGIIRGDYLSVADLDAVDRRLSDAIKAEEAQS